MARRSVIFRADGDQSIGLGHLVRSSALAEMLAPGYDCHLVYRHCPDDLLRQWNDICASVTRIDTTVSPEAESLYLARRALAAGGETAIVVLDGYQFNTEYQRQVIAAGLQLVCIDDLHREKFLAHLVINHAPGATIADYQGADRTHFALGLRFALLRKPFRALAAAHSATPTPTRIFICLGGADPNNDTLDVLRELAEKKVDLPIDLVIGSAYRHHRELNAYLAAGPQRITVHEQVSAAEMALLMGRSTLGITSPSTVALEYLNVNGQLYLRQIAANQADVLHSLLELGLAREFSDLTFAASELLLSERGGLMDGAQDIRFRKLFAALDLNLRAAREDDLSMYFEWANNPSVRSQSFNTQALLLVDHEAWFVRKLADPACELLVCERRGEPVGQVRLQLDADTATLSYSIAAGARGQGLGLAMLHYAGNYLRKYRPAIRTLIGYVKVDNVASLLTFRRLGYRELPTLDYPGAVKFVLHEF